MHCVFKLIYIYFSLKGGHFRKLSSQFYFKCKKIFLSPQQLSKFTHELNIVKNEAPKSYTTYYADSSDDDVVNDSDNYIYNVQLTDQSNEGRYDW